MRTEEVRVCAQGKGEMSCIVKKSLENEEKTAFPPKNEFSWIEDWKQDENSDRVFTYSTSHL